MSEDVTRQNYKELTPEQQKGMKLVKQAGETLIKAIKDHCPQGREASLALTNAEQSVMWAVKGLTA